MKTFLRIGIPVLLVAVFAVLSLFLYDGARRQAVDDLNRYQKILLDQAAQSVNEVYLSWTRVLSQAAQNQDIISLNEKGRALMDFLVNSSEGELSGMTRMGPDGRIRYTYPDSGGGYAGRDLSGQKHVRKALETRKPVLSDTFKAVQGYSGIAYHYPVFRNGQYDGTIAVMLNAEQIARRIFGTINIGRSGYAWVMDGGGIELYCRVPGHIGHHISDTARGFADIQSMAREMMAGKNGSGYYTYNQIAGRKVQILTKLAYYRPVPFGDTLWSAVAATPADEVTDNLAAFRNNLFIVFLIILVIALSVLYYIQRTWAAESSQEAVRQSEGRFRGMAENISDGLLIQENGRTVYSNPQFAAITGIDPSGQGLNNMMDTLVRPDMLHENPMGTALPGKSASGYTVTAGYIRPDGNRRELEVTVVSDPDDLTRIYTVVTDITEKIRQSEALRESERRMAAIIDFLPDATFAIDRDGRVIAWNKAIEEMSGVSKENMLGKCNHEYAIPFFAERRPILCDLVLEKAGIYEKEYLEFKRVGQSVVAEAYNPIIQGGKGVFLWGIAAPLYNRKGEVEGVIECIRDVTERRKGEEEIRRLNVELEDRVARRTRELAQAYSEMESFTYSVSHDLRTPLRSIDGFARALSDDYRNLLPEEGRKFLERILDSTVRMSGLIDDLLKLSRITRADLQVMKVDLTALCEKIADTLNTSEPGRRVDWVIEKNLVVLADERLLTILMENLLSNAFKFTARTDKPVIKIGKLYENGREMFYVRDNGAGFDMQYAGKLFVVFQRLHNERDYPGTGVGLSIVKRIVERHKGMIRAEGKPDMGAVFLFCLCENGDDDLRDKAAGDKQ